MSLKRYISVILPLKLEWEPCYYVEENMEVSAGDRVKVRFANKEYIGVVSGTGISPDIDHSRIQPVISLESDLEKILDTEIALWRHVSDYYLCSVGEVYKAAYPLIKINMEEARAASRHKAIMRKQKIADSIKARIERLDSRLEKKTAQLNSSKEGSKTQFNLKKDINKILNEKALAENAYIAALDNIGSIKAGHATNGKQFLESKIQLSPAQDKALQEIKNTFGSGKPALLHGLTGSGKTEIYIRLAQEALSEGKNVLYLVPEIALSRQLEERLHQHFGDRLLTYHSSETAASRRDTAEAVRNTEANLILGTRSAIFLPLHKLGLIIVDEEHDSSYKQDSPAPRYNGRDTALMLHRIHSCPIILGSATPSLEEMYNCSIGRHVRTELLERYHGAQEADTELIDTKAERKKRGMVGNFSRKLIAHISDTLSKGEQILILRSRRSWAPVLQCEECGEIVRCPHCNVSLNMHKDGNPRMVCHYCGYTHPYTGKCSKCSGNLAGIGAGTQRIEEEAAELFPNARIARLDSDTTQDKSYENKVIKDFSKGEIDILIGTQIITKGFDFGRLTLVAVIAADSLLGMMDFRADEKALQLLEQFKGRCGRRNTKGLIVIQTSQPEHPVYQRIASSEENNFHQDLLQERKTFGFPPYSRIMEILIRDIYEDRAQRMAEKLAKALSSCGLSPASQTGPYSPSIDKIADQHIRAIRINLKKGPALSQEKEAVKKAIDRFGKEMKYESHITINVDPS